MARPIGTTGTAPTRPRAPQRANVYVPPPSIVPQPAKPKPANVYVPPASLAPHVAAPSHLATPATDAQTSGPGYGSAQANAYKQTASYRQSVAAVFRSQPASQKAAIIAGLVHSNAFDQPEFHAVRSVWDRLSMPEQIKIGNVIPHDLPKFLVAGENIGTVLGNVSRGIGAASIGAAERAATKTIAEVDAGAWQKARQSMNQGDLGSAIGPAVSSVLHQRTLMQQIAGRTGAVTTPAQALDVGLGALEHGLTAVQPHSGRFQQQGLSAGGLGQAIVHMPINVTRAALQNPSVIPNTAKGLGETAIGALPGLIEAAQHPMQTAKAMIADYKRRYGGTDAQIIARIKASPQGAAPEVIDALTILGAADATAGRAAVGLARTREALTGKPNILTRERPGLRVSGGVTREQPLAKGAGKILAQRAEDRLRAALAGRSEIKPRPGEVAPVFGKRAQRIQASKVVARTRTISQQALNAEIRSRKGAQGAVNRLSYAERKAFTVAIEGGIPLRSGADTAKAWIDRHIAIIEKDRHNVLSPGGRIAPQHAGQIDDLGLLKWMRENTGKWLTPKLAQTVDREGARAMKIDEMAVRGGAIHPATAEARRLRVQGELHGIEHPNVAVENQLASLEERAAHQQARIAALTEGKGAAGASDTQVLHELRAAHAELKQTQDSITVLQHPDAVHALHQSYIQQVRAAAKEAGMPEQPGFLHHQPHPKTDFGAFTTGTGHAAMPPIKKSEFALWRGGAVDRSSQAYVNGLAHSIKRPFQWKLTDEQFRASALPAPSADAIKAALGHAKPADKLTLFELKQAMLHDGVNMDHVMFYRPGQLKTSTLKDLRTGSLDARKTGTSMTPSELEANQQIADALEQEHTVQPGNSDIPVEYANQVGWKALPRAAYEEIHSSLQPSGFAGRMVGKVQGLNAMMILGGSPSFVVMNSLADALVATLGTRGKVLADAVKYPLWAKSLSEQDLAWFKAHSGGRAGFRPERLGSTAKSGLVRGWRELGQRGLPRFLKASNPIAALFHGQAAFSDFMRHVVQYSEMKRMALENIGREMGPAAKLLEQVQQALKLHPTLKVDEQLQSILHSQPMLEQAGQHTLSMMGDYTRFTARERRLLNNRAILFYSFLRYATRMLFYTLPLHHPILTGLVGEMSKLHGDEVRKLLGGVDLPWAYSRIFIDKNGKLYSIDTIRSSPVGSIGTDITTQGIQDLSQTVFPELQILLNQMYGKTPSGQPYPRGVFSALNDILSMSYLYRAGSTQHFGLQPQQADSIPFLHERPDLKKTAAAQAYQQAKMAASGPLLDKQLSSLLGVFPRPDNSKIVAAHQAGQKAGSGGGGYSISSSSTGSGGYSIAKPSGGGSGYLLGSPTQGGGAEGMKPSQQGGKLLGAIQFAGGAAGNAPATVAANLTTSSPVFAARTASWDRQLSPVQQKAQADAWWNTMHSPAALAKVPIIQAKSVQQALKIGSGQAVSLVRQQQAGNAKVMAGFLDPSKPFSFLQTAPAFASPKVPAGTSKGMAAVISMANAITTHHYNYEWGGGHGAIGVPAHGVGHGSGPGVGFDCSGAVSAILHAAGVLNQPLVAAQFMTYGQPGAGTSPNDVTIYASQGHVVSQIGGRFFGTSSAHNPGQGADWFNASAADYPGYAVRHVSLPAGTTARQVVQRVPQSANWMVALLPSKTRQDLVKRVQTQPQLPSGTGGTAGNKVAVINGAPLSDSQKVFGAELAKKTGLDPGVIAAWIHSEQPPTGLAPNGSHNWLNIGATGSGFFGGSDPAWRSPATAADRTAQWLRGQWAPQGYGHASPGIQAVLRTAGQSPAAQVRALQQSGWAASGYPALAQVYSSLAGAVSLGTANVNLPAGGSAGGGSSVALSGGGGGTGSVGSPAASGGVPTADAGTSLGVPNAPSTQPVNALDQFRLSIVQSLLAGAANPWNVSTPSFGSLTGASSGLPSLSPKAWDTSTRRVKV